MNKNRCLYICTLVLTAQEARAAIKVDGMWTGNDWYDSTSRIGVLNGVPYSEDANMQRMLRSPLSLDGPIDDYLQMTNVQRVQTVFSAEQWNAGFPHANPVYSYNDFLKAVAKFPAFCNENNLPGYSDEDACKRELATIFAHWGQETGWRNPGAGEFWTQGLFYVEEINKNDYKSWEWGNHDKWPNQAGVQYYGRGPMQLSWNYNYGQFSNIFSTTGYDSKMELLVDPGKVSRNGYVAMAAGLWFYMTPQDPKPSMHDVMTGYFTPNSVDLANGLTTSFATTINIINGGLECGKGLNTDKVKKRGEYFLNWLNFFGQDPEGDLDCGLQPNRFPAGGSADISMYFTAGNSQGTCKLATWATLYSSVARDDYKRCVCDNWGTGAADCPIGPIDTSNQSKDTLPVPPQPEPQPEPSPEPQPEPSPEPVPDVWKTWATLLEIRDTPHYSSSSYSRTLYQVDRELDFIEKKIKELYEVALTNALL